MPLTLTIPPGFSDLDDAILAAGFPALGIELAEISNNAAFGLTRPEIFVSGPYQNGETVPTPVSPIDGYVYSRNELLYLWTIQNSVDKSSGWITGKDSLWFAFWDVDQSTGQVFSSEWYRRSGLHYDGAHTNDGTLTVWTVAQRQQTNLIMAATASYSAVSSGWIGQDKPLSQQLAQALNHDAKFSIVNKEVFYLGEYYDGQTVTMPTSPADGYSYVAAECKFMFSWRWTTPGNLTHVAEPDLADGQLGPMLASVDSSGVVSTTVKYDDNNGNILVTNDGRIAVFAFCQRSATPASISPAATNFAEIPFQLFMPGNPLPFDTIIQQTLDNTLEAIVTPEYFGPTTHQDGDTIAVPTSPIDGYTYSRSELTYVWTFTDTSPATGSNLRVASFGGAISQTTGIVNLYGYRLPPGGPYTLEDSSQPRISVIIFARRAAALPSSITGSTTDPGGNVDGSSAGSGADVPTLSGTGYDHFDGDSSTTVFTLSNVSPIIGAMVYWNGTFQKPTKYSITGTTGSALTTAFTDADGNSQPADTNDDIDVVWFF